MKKPSPPLIGMAVGIGIILFSIAFEYFYRPYVIGANIGTGILFMVGLVTFGVAGVIYLIEDNKTIHK